MGSQESEGRSAELYRAARERTFLPAPQGSAIGELEGLLDGLGSAEGAARDTLIAQGLISFGPHLPNALRSRVGEPGDYESLIVRAYELLGAWLGGSLFTSEQRELTRRAASGLQLWAEGGPVGEAFERLSALCVLALPVADELRDEALARAMLEASLQRARARSDSLEVLRCGCSLLRFVSYEQGSSLIEEGLRLLDGTEDQLGTPEGFAVECEWRSSAAMALSLEGQRLSTGDQQSREQGKELLRASLTIYEPVLADKDADASTAIQSLWMWGMLTMNAGHLPLAAEVLKALRSLATPDSYEGWHARFEEGMVRADMGEWKTARELLAAMEESLLANYAASVCLGVDDDGIVRSHLSSERVDAGVHRELSEGLGALALSEAALGDWPSAFRHVETVKALDYRQQRVLRRAKPGEVGSHEPVTTVGHSAWAHGVPPREASRPRAQLAAMLAHELRAPELRSVGQALRGDEAVLSLGIGAGTWATGILSGDCEQPSVRVFRDDIRYDDWMKLLSTGDDGALVRPVDVASLKSTLDEVLPRADELIARPLAGLLEQREVKRVTVIPHGWLNLLPVWALPSLSDVAVSVAASASLLDIGDRLAISVGTGLVVVDPTGNLPASHGEYAALVRHGLDRRIVLQELAGTGATADAIEAAWADAGILHFTGHAVGNAILPEEVGLFVSEGTPNSAWLWHASELSAGRKGLDGCGLAVLSACESGRSEIRLDSISDYSGLPSALQAAGVSAVVSTLWAVPDDAALLFSDLFYEGLGGETPVDLPLLVRRATRALETLTGDESSSRILALRELVTDRLARLRLEAYARRFAGFGTRAPFEHSAAPASFYHTGTRFLRVPGGALP